jgi:hypothetical protein
MVDMGMCLAKDMPERGAAGYVPRSGEFKQFSGTKGCHQDHNELVGRQVAEESRCPTEAALVMVGADGPVNGWKKDGQLP